MLNNFGIQLKRVKALIAEREYFQRLLTGSKCLYEQSLGQGESSGNDIISAMVFSKDRPLQLEALLHSYFKLVANPAPLRIIFKASTERVKQHYRQLAAEYSSKEVAFHEENNFYNQVIQWLEIQTADRVFFLTDDAVFLDKVDLKDCLDFNPVLNLFSLRHGVDLDYSFPFQRKEELPQCALTVKSDKTFIVWNWRERMDSPDWSYPLSVDGCIYSRLDMLAVCSSINFKNPNTLEANMQVFVDFFSSKSGVAYQKAKLVNVPCNLVQTEFKNRSTDLFTVEELLDVWESGKRIDTNMFEGNTAFDAMHKKYQFIKSLEEAQS